MSLFLLSVEALDGSDTPTTLRFSSGEYTGDGELWEPCLKQPALFRSAAFVGSILGREPTRGGFGMAELVNVDGGLNYLADYAVDGRAVTLTFLNDDGSEHEIAASARGLVFDKTLVRLELRDPLEALAKPIAGNVYAGNNALPAGVEGTADDIKGIRKPLVFGKVRNAEPYLVNTARLIYQVHDGSGVQIMAAYDRGVALIDDGEAASLAALQIAVVSAGHFKRFLGLFKLGASPAGTVTCDVDNTVADAGSVFEAIASGAGFTVNAADVTAADAIGEVGIYLIDDTKRSELLDRIARSIGGFWGINDAGEVRLRQLEAPAVSPDFAIEPYQVLEVAREATGSGRNGLPVWRVVLEADKVETVQNDLASSVSEARKARMQKEFRESVVEDSATLTRHPLSEELVIETCLRSLSVADTEAARLSALLKVRRDVVRVRASLDEVSLESLVIGATFSLTTPRLGYSAGRSFRVLGFEIDARNKRADVFGWG